MMSNVTTIGLDIAKSVFQVHGVDAAGEVAVRRKLTRGPPRIIGLASSSHLATMCGCCRHST
jgi:transposase